MELLHLEPYLQTPEVDFDPITGIFLLSGKCYPADAIEFYQPIISWVQEYVKTPAAKTQLTCELEYLNSASQKQLVELLTAFKPLQSSGMEFIVHWKYEEGDDDIQSVGELFEHELEMSFSYEEF